MELIAVLISVAGLFLWNRSESRNDIRSLEAKLESFQREIQKEMKDFHGRLCAIEESRK